MIPTHSHRRERGQGLVEFALAIPIMTVLFIGLIEIAYLVFQVNALAAASREAARYGAAMGGGTDGVPRYMDCEGMRKAALKIGSFARMSDTDISIQYDHGPGTQVFAASCPPPAEIQRGDRVVVSIRANYSPFIPLIPLPDFPIQSDSAHTILMGVNVQP